MSSEPPTCCLSPKYSEPRCFFHSPDSCRFTQNAVMMKAHNPPNPFLTLNPVMSRSSYQMTRQQKIRNPFPNRILMPTVPTHQLPLHYLRLHQKRMQLLHHLLIRLQLLSRGRL